MGYRFWRRVKIAPGLTLNLSKSGPSLSVGPRGAKLTVGARGKRATVGIPGTGLFYTTRLDAGHATARQPRPTSPRRSRLDPGFFAKLLMSADEKEFVAGCQALVSGDDEAALGQFKQALHLADAAYLAGFIELKLNRLKEAAADLLLAMDMSDQLGSYLSKYGIDATMTLSITDEIHVDVGADLRGVLLALVEIYQRFQQWHDAIACLERLQRLEPGDPVITLSLVELLLTEAPSDPKTLTRIVELTANVANESAVHTAIMLYKARALRGLSMLDAARETLTAALRRKKGRPAGLLKAVRTERALVYEAQGRHRQARAEWERLYAEAPDDPEIAAHLKG